MRLVLCIVGSLAIHFGILVWTKGSFQAPALSLSHKAHTFDLQIRMQMRDSFITPVEKEPEEKVEPTPPPRPEPTPRPLPKKALKRVKVEKKPPEPASKIEKDKQESLPKAERQYISESQNAPRKVERAEYLNNPPPEYPRQARRRRQEGTCTLLVDVKADGTVSAVVVKQSSGHSSLDAAAKEAVARWRFSPAVAGNRNVESQVIVPILFRLKQ